MTYYSENENPSQRIKDAAQIIEIIGDNVSLKKSGANYKGLCPFHQEKTPSFMVNPERQTFHCFGCGEGGDVFTFLMKYHNMTFPEAMKELAERYQIPLPEKKFTPADSAMAKKREEIFAVNDLAASIYHEFLVKDQAAAAARAYLKQRGLDRELTADFRLGYAPDSWDFLLRQLARKGVKPAIAEEGGLLVRKDRGGHYDRFRDRIMFPIFDLTGKAVGFSGRILGQGEPKYLNTPETMIFDKGRTLYGLHRHRDSIRKRKKAIIVEGNFDLLSLVAHGIDYVVAPLGTALTQPHIRIIKGYAEEVILLFDGDTAGINAAMRAVPLFLSERVVGRIAVLPTGHDPDTFIREHGREGIEKYLDAALPLSEFIFSRLVDRHGLSLEGKNRIIDELRPLIENAEPDSLQLSVFVSHFSDKLGVDRQLIIKGLKIARGKDRPAEKKSLAMPPKQRRLLEFLVVYPEFLPQFVAAGVEDILDDPAALTIIKHIKEIKITTEKAKPEALLDVLPAGPEKSFVSSLLVSSPVLSTDEDAKIVKKMAAEKIGWLQKERLKAAAEVLSRELAKAQQENNDQAMQELMRKKMEISKALEAISARSEE